MNIGALQALEKLCSARIPAIFLVEHSCEATVPQLLQGLVTVVATGNPQRISLAGHDEYTLRFSQLERIASAWGYTTRRGPIADFLPLRLTDRLRNILAAPQARSDTQEIIRHFAGDLFQYEYLLLSLGSAESCWECLTTAGQDVLPCQRCGQCCLTNFIAYASPADTERWHREGRFDIIATVAHEHAAWMGDHFVSAEDGRYLHGCPFLRWRDGLHSCSIYETRPEVCRRYQPGSSELCSQWRKHGHQK